MVKNILLVDDEKEFVNSVSRHLSMEGFFVETAFNGCRAQEMINKRAAEKNPFELVISDINMPDMGGLELLNWVQKEHPSLSLLIITGFGSADYLQSRIRPDFDGYYQKPITPAKMLELIASISTCRMTQAANK